MSLTRAVFLVASLLAALPSGASAVDLHKYWDQRCAECHGHSADFARRFLSVRDGKLLGKHHVEDLTLFLRNHYLADDLVEPVSRMLATQLTTAPRFRKECGRCHKSAAALARAKLTLRENALVSRASGQPAAAFLDGHAGLTASDISFYVDVLTRVTREVESR